MSDLVKKALSFATTKHTGQKRKYTGEDYIVHPVAVKNVLIDHGFGDEDWLAAALLHDVVEDTGTSIQELSDEFNPVVAEIVYWLSDIENRDSVGNRAARKKLNVWKLSRAPIGAQLIKLADLIDNSKTILTHDPEFAPKYLEEKRALMDNLMLPHSALREQHMHTSSIVMQALRQVELNHRPRNARTLEELGDQQRAGYMIFGGSGGVVHFESPFREQEAVATTATAGSTRPRAQAPRFRAQYTIQPEAEQYASVNSTRTNNR